MDLEHLVGEARERELRPMPARERVVAGGLALACAISAVGLLILVPFNHHATVFAPRRARPARAVARRVGFEVGSVEAFPEQLVLIPMLFVAPLPLVPILLACAYVIARLPEFISGRMHPDRWLYPVGDAMHAVPAVVVLATLAPGHLAASHAGVYVLALAAQLGTGIACGVLADSVLSIAPLQALRSMVLTYRIDAVLTPIAYMAAAVAVHEPVALLAIVPLLWLLQVFSSERRERFAAALELNQAYRGTVMVLSDVVEAEDNYTASHCRSVVELAAAVADELGMPERTRQELEIAALLHDVGKIAIPNEILNKPSKLTDEEFALMKTHTVEGQALLNRVGGRLARVGEIVRSCHERWDGKGYPDGLRGEEIPLRRADRVLLRRVQRDDHRPPVPQGDEPRVRARGAAQQRRLAVRAARRGGAPAGRTPRPARAGVVLHRRAPSGPGRQPAGAGPRALRLSATSRRAPAR